MMNDCDRKKSEHLSMPDVAKHEEEKKEESKAIDTHTHKNIE
jgi:hypothetical protein